MRFTPRLVGSGRNTTDFQRNYQMTKKYHVNGFTGKIIPGVGYVRVPNPPPVKATWWPFKVLFWIVVLLAVVKFF
jgi:hypothetical protein